MLHSLAASCPPLPWHQQMYQNALALEDRTTCRTRPCQVAPGPSTSVTFGTSPSEGWAWKPQSPRTQSQSAQREPLPPYPLAREIPMPRSQDEGISQMPTGSISFEIVFLFCFCFLLLYMGSPPVLCSRHPWERNKATDLFSLPGKTYLRTFFFFFTFNFKGAS